jgi:hypothetical protein
MTHVNKSATGATRKGLLGAAMMCFDKAGLKQRQQEVKVQLALYEARTSEVSSTTAAASSTVATGKHHQQAVPANTVLVAHLNAAVECLKAGMIDAAAKCLWHAREYDLCGKLFAELAAVKVSESGVTDAATMLYCNAAKALEKANNVKEAAKCYQVVKKCALAVTLLRNKGMFSDALACLRKHKEEHAGKHLTVITMSVFTNVYIMQHCYMHAYANISHVSKICYVSSYALQLAAASIVAVASKSPVNTCSCARHSVLTHCEYDAAIGCAHCSIYRH